MEEEGTDGAQWLGVGEVARLYGVHRNTVHNWIKSGRLEAHKVIENGREMYRINAESLKDVRTDAPVRSVDAQRTNDSQELAEALGQRMQEIVQSHSQEMGALREELGRERQRREELEKRLKEYEHSSEESGGEEAGGEEDQQRKRRPWWRRMFGG